MWLVEMATACAEPRVSAFLLVSFRFHYPAVALLGRQLPIERGEWSVLRGECGIRLPFFPPPFATLEFLWSTGTGLVQLSATPCAGKWEERKGERRGEVGDSG